MYIYIYTTRLKSSCSRVTPEGKDIIRKNRKLEQVLIQQQEQINTLDFLFSKLTTSLSAIDEKVWVEGDEELGEVFNDIKEIKDTLNSLYN